MKVLVLVVALALSAHSTDVSARCKRFVPQPGAGPDIDGPGSFGPLQDTLTLDCLVFKGVIYRRNGAVALLEDEKGTTYKVRRGERIGENAMVVQIAPTRIKLAQLVSDGAGGWVETTRYMELGQDHRRD